MSRGIHIFALNAFLTFSIIVCGQGTAVTKAQAMRSVKTSSIEGWQETISDDGRFRILFPSKPQSDEGPLKGFRNIEGDDVWRASYLDFEEPRLSDDSHLRPAYHSAVGTMARDGERVSGQRDVFLNGRLGIEFVIEGKGTVSYMRGFLFGRRMYTLSVKRKGTPNTNGIPIDVQRFFDSFAYWD